MKLTARVMIGLCYLSLPIYMFFFVGRLKAMWVFGEAIMLEPNKLISGFEYFFGIILTMFITYISVTYIYELYFDFFNFVKQKFPKKK